MMMPLTMAEKCVWLMLEWITCFICYLTGSEYWCDIRYSNWNKFKIVIKKIRSSMVQCTTKKITYQYLKDVTEITDPCTPHAC